MGELNDLCEAEFSDLYWPLLSPGSSRADEVFSKVARVRSDLEDIQALLKGGWREQVVGAVACLFHPEREACRALLWRAFDGGSWATPQLAVCAMLLDPGDFAEVRRRLLLRCPSVSDHLEGTEPIWRHVVHGGAAITSHNMKGMAALIEAYSCCPEGTDWLQKHLPFEDAYWGLEVDHWDNGVGIARGWRGNAGPVLEKLGFAVPEWMKVESAKNLLKLWDIAAQPSVVRTLCSGEWPDRIYRFFHAFVKQGHTSLLIEGDKQGMKVFGRTVNGNQVLLDLKGPYYEALWLRLEFETRDSGIYEFRWRPQDIAALQVEMREKGMSVLCLSEHRREPDFQITERSLEDCPAQIWVIGIDAQARLDGGVAGMVDRLAGESLQPSLQEGLARGDRRPGAVTITEAFELNKLGVRRLAHIVTVPKPDMTSLCRGLEIILEYASRHYSSLAMPAVGCGAAGLSAHEVAGPVLEVLARYKDQVRITLSLPREADRVAFQRAARAQGLTG